MGRIMTDIPCKRTMNGEHFVLLKLADVCRRISNEPCPLERHDLRGYADSLKFRLQAIKGKLNDNNNLPIKTY